MIRRRGYSPAPPSSRRERSIPALRIDRQVPPRSWRGEASLREHSSRSAIRFTSASCQRIILVKASSLSYRLAVLFVITGMAMGIGMAASQNHAIMPAHAHLNLLGWVSLFLFGIYYERRPALDQSRLALVQVGVWSLGTVVLTIAVAAIHLGYEAADPVAA